MITYACMHLCRPIDACLLEPQGLRMHACMISPWEYRKIYTTNHSSIIWLLVNVYCRKRRGYIVFVGCGYMCVCARACACMCMCVCMFICAIVHKCRHIHAYIHTFHAHMLYTYTYANRNMTLTRHSIHCTESAREFSF
jgi:hypothetical protein